MSSIEAKYRYETPEHIEVDFDLAGPGSRFCAWLLDAVIIGALLAGLALLQMALLPEMTEAAATEGADWSDRAVRWTTAVLVLIAFLILIGYFVFFEMLMRGQSPGKRAAKLRVMRDDATPITLVDSLLRNLLRIVDFVPIFYGLGGLVSLLHPRHKRLGDLAAGTIVVKERALDYRAETDRRQEEADASDSWDGATLGGELSAQERKLLRGFLDRRTELSPEKRVELAEKLARPLHAKYGGEYGDGESYIERLIHGDHHES